MQIYAKEYENFQISVQKYSYTSAKHRNKLQGHYANNEAQNR